MRPGRILAYSAVIASEDGREGPRAFGENRPPVWTSR
jgi:enoyl-CoA hydratase/carnithine racemase